MKKLKPSVNVSKPPARLLALVNRPGGLLREEAIARGMKNIEAQRIPAQHAMLNLIAALESMDSSPWTVETMRNSLELTDQLISLATMFGNEQLAQVGKRLCALILALIAMDREYPEPISVHIRALRLFAPPTNPPPPVSHHIQAGLDKILLRFGVPPYLS